MRFNNKNAIPIVGSKIKIKDENWYNKCNMDGNIGIFVPKMAHYLGKDAIIKRVIEKTNGNIVYNINIDNQFWDWPRDSFELID